MSYFTSVSRLSAEEITVAYDDTDPVVQSLSLGLADGEITAIVGPNACGKSTLLRALARLHQPSAGAVLLDGEEIHRRSTKEVARRLGLLPQQPEAPEAITVEDLTRRGRYPHQALLQTMSRRDQQAVERAMAMAGMSELRDRLVDELSGGQRQRAWIAMALAQETGILLLDEPTTFLDLAHRAEVLRLLRRLNREEGRTICVVLHDVNDALHLSDRLVAMRDGAIAAEGATREVLTPDLLGDVFGVHCDLVGGGHAGERGAGGVGRTRPGDAPQADRAAAVHDRPASGAGGQAGCAGSGRPEPGRAGHTAGAGRSHIGTAAPYILPRSRVLPAPESTRRRPSGLSEPPEPGSAGPSPAKHAGPARLSSTKRAGRARLSPANPPAANASGPSPPAHSSPAAPAGPGTSALQAHNLSAGYERRPVLETISAAIPRGAITAILGPNACGKSTLLRALARLLKPAGGDVLLHGAPITAVGRRELARRLAMLAQGSDAPAGLTVEELVAAGRYPHQRWFRQWSREDRTAIDRALAVVGIGALRNKHVDTLSGGQRRRAWLAMALAQQSEILLLDEPTTFLDIAHQVEVLDLAWELNRNGGRTVVMVLHDLWQASRYADHLILMKAGRATATGNPAEVLTPEQVRDVFAVESEVWRDPQTSAPFAVPELG